MVQGSRDGTEISVTKETGEVSEDARVDAINSLHDDELRKIFEILGKGYFRAVAGACKRFNRMYKQVHPDCLTSVENLVQSVSGAALFRKEAKRRSHFRLSVNVPCLHSPDGVSTLTWSRLHCFEFIRDVAALHGRLEVLKLTLQWPECWYGTEYTCNLAAMNGHLGVLQWLREQGNPWDTKTRNWAAAKGQLEVLKWALANGCPGNMDTCFHAARFGQLDVLKWARVNGFPCSELTLFYAKSNGHMDVVEWALKDGYPGWF